MLKELDLFGSKIPMFVLLIGIGVIFAMLIYYLQIKNNKEEQKRYDKFGALLPIIILGGIFGAILFDKIAHWGEKEWYKPAGISFAGGLFLGIILYIIFYPKIVSKDKKHFIKDISILTCPMIIAHAFGRVGCFFAGCCYGKPSNSFLAVTFPEGSLQHQQYGYITPVLPTQLFEAVFLFLLFIVIFFFIKKYKTPVYLFSYAIARYIIEFFRGDNRGKILSFMTPSQMMSILFIILGIYFLIIERKNYKETYIETEKMQE